MSEITFPSGDRVLVSDVRILNPALDANPGECLILGVPLPGIRVVRTRSGLDEIPDILLCILSSKKFNPATKSFEDQPELFQCTVEEFSKRGWFTRVPLTSLEQRWPAVKIREFLSGTSPRVNAQEIYQKILARWRFYMDFEKNPGSDGFSALWTIGSYFFFLFRYYPYLKWGGTKGVGKSKAGTTANGMCFNSTIFSGATESSIFRLASDTRGTQIIDEQEQLKDEEANAYIQVLNSGFQADGFAIRTNKETMRVERWPTFSPKMICSISGLRETLEDRAVEIVIYMSGSMEIKSREPPSAESADWEPIRGDLYLLLFQEWRRVCDIYNNLQNSYGYDGRFWNITKPILAIAKLVDQSSQESGENTEAGLIQFLSTVLKAKKSTATGTGTARVIFALKGVLDGKHAREKTPDDYSYRVAISEVIEQGVKDEGEWFKEEYKPRGVANILKNVHLYESPKRRKGGFTFEVSRVEISQAIDHWGLGLLAVIP